MKRNMATKKSRTNIPKYKDLKKPFGFCCDMNRQDPETQYDMRIPPFESIFPETPWDTSRPDVKFRLQDVTKTTAAPPQVLRAGIYREDVEIKKATTYGRSKKGRKPLAWFLEDEIEAARDIIAERKKAKFEEMQKKKAVKKGKKKRKKPKSSVTTDDNKKK